MLNPLVVRTPKTSCKKEEKTPKVTHSGEASRLKRITTRPRKIIILRTSATPEVSSHGSKPLMRGSLIKLQDRTKCVAVSLRDHQPCPHIAHWSGSTRKQKEADESSVTERNGGKEEK